MRGPARLWDVEKRAVLNILKLADEVSKRLFTVRVQGVRVLAPELDEVWSFVWENQAQIRPGELSKEIGDAYTLISLEKTSNLVVS